MIGYTPDRSSAFSWEPRDPKETPYLIVRLKAPDMCSWIGSPPKPSYRQWAAFATRAERDAELKRLREATEWTLRPAKLDVFGHGWEIEDEEADLLARLALLKS